MQGMDKKRYRSYSKAIVAAINGYFERQEHMADDPYLETREKEDAFLRRITEAEARDRVKERKARMRRLIQEGAILEKAFLLELKEVQKTVKEKLMERKTLSDEKGKCPAWEVGKRIQMTRQYAALTEDVEELKSRRAQIFAALGCKEEAEVKAIEKKTDSLENLRMKLEDQQKMLNARKIW